MQGRCWRGPPQCVLSPCPRWWCWTELDLASGVNMAGLITLFMAIISWGQPTCHSNTIVNMEIIVRGTSNKLSLKLHFELINFSSKEFYLGVVYVCSHISSVTPSRLTRIKSCPIEMFAVIILSEKYVGYCLQ